MTRPPLRDRVVRRLARFIADRPGWVLAPAILFGACFWSFLPKVSLRPDVDDFLAVKDPSFSLIQRVQSLFPNNEFLVVAYENAALFTPENLAFLKKLTEDLEGLERPKSVLSLANVNDMVGENDSFSVRPFLETIPTDPADLATLRRRALENPLFLDRLISRDGRTTSMVIYTRMNEKDPHYRGDLIEDIRRVLAPYQARGQRFHLAGWPVTNFFLSDFMRRDLRRFLPITFVLVTLTLWIVFRNLRLLFLAGIGILSTVAATVGLTAVLGVPLNNASSAVIPIVMALALSDTVHVFSHLSADVLKQCPDRRSALTHVLEQVLFPCLLTSVNTAIGFFSLSFSGIPAVRVFGWLASAGMVFEFIATFGMVVPLLLVFRPETIYRETRTHRRRWIPQAIRGIHRFVTQHPRLTLGACVLAMGWGAWECRRVRAETNLFEWFQPSTTVRRDLNFVLTHLSGVLPADVFLEAETDGAFREPETLAALEGLAKKIKAVPGVDNVTSLVDYFKEMNQSFHDEDPAFYRLPGSRRLADQYLLLYGADDLDDYVTSDYRRSRLKLRLRSTSTLVNEHVLKKIREVLRENPVPGVTGEVSGDALLHVVTAKTLVGEQVQNIFSAVVTIWLVMVVVLRSIGWASLFLVPNLFPILINFGLMGVLSISLDSGTSLIAAAAFGVIVDDTVHFFVRFRELRSQGLPYFEVLEEVSYEKGEASTSSFFIMCAGFGVLSLSGFRPIMYFGILNVVVLLVGFVGDQLLLKSLLVLGGQWRKAPSLVGAESGGR